MAKATTGATPAESEAARLERETWRKRLRRRIKELRAEAGKATVVGEDDILNAYADVLQQELDWLLKRSKRFNDRTGGLGRK